MKILHIALAALAACAVAQPAGAATVSVQPSSAQVASGSSFTVDLVLDATDAPGTHPGLYGGQVELAFDPALLSYTGFTLASGVSFFSDPEVVSANGRTTVTLGFQDAGDAGRVGTYSFDAIGTPGSVATLDIEDARPFFGTFVAQVPTIEPFYPTFIDGSVNIVPLPGTAWLLITGFGVVAARARRLARA